MMNRVCRVCGKEKPIDEFPKVGKGYHSQECFDCQKARRKAYYEENKGQIKSKRSEYYESNKEEIAEKRKYLRQTKEYKSYVQSYKEKNRDKILAQKRESNKRHKDTYKSWTKLHDKELAEKRKINYHKNREKIFGYIYNKKSTDALYKLKFTLRCRIYTALQRKSWQKNGTTEQLVGADCVMVKKHIEGLFKDGMTWENHGEWHIDHIIPLASAKTEDEIRKLFHYTNLQPLWAEDNLRKRDKIFVNEQVERID